MNKDYSVVYVAGSMDVLNCKIINPIYALLMQLRLMLVLWQSKHMNQYCLAIPPSYPFIYLFHTLCFSLEPYSLWKFSPVTFAKDFWHCDPHYLGYVDPQHYLWIFFLLLCLHSGIFKIEYLFDKPVVFICSFIWIGEEIWGQSIQESKSKPQQKPER